MPMLQTDQKALACIEKYISQCRTLAEYLLANPEVGGQEEKAVRYLRELLEPLGYQVTMPYVNVPHSFLAVNRARGDFHGPRAVLLCEYDALPGLGHACGHAISCAASVLAALAINETYPDLPFRVDLMGTPAEENLGGKIQIRKNGGFTPYVLAGMAHMGSRNVTDYRTLASNDRYYTFLGKSAHASAAPQDGLNALNAARLYMDAMDMWRQHMPPGCQHHGIIVHGGDAPNIVPEQVELDWYFRAERMQDLYRLNTIADTCARAAAMAMETEVHILQRCPDYCDLSSSEFKTNLLNEHFALTGRFDCRRTHPSGSGDVGNVDLDIPVLHPMVDAVEGADIALHTKEFEAKMHEEAAFRAMEDSAVILLTLFHRLAVEKETFRRLQDDHAAYRGL